MQIEFFVTPLTGALIGYITNDLAIRMLFHPHKAVYIGKLKLPFTPGLIPREQPRIAKALAGVIAQTILDEKTLKDNLLCDKTLDKIRDAVSSYIDKNRDNEKTLKEILCTVVSDNDLEKAETSVAKKVSQTVIESAKEGDLSASAAAFFTEYVKEHLGGPVAMFVAPILEKNIAPMIKDAIDSYLADSLCETAEGMALKKIKEYEDMRVCDIITKNADLSEKITEYVLKIYKVFVTEHFGRVLASVNIEEIAREKIMSFDSKQLEALIFGIMKKELRAIVNIGAVLGFLIGIVALFI